MIDRSRPTLHDRQLLATAKDRLSYTPGVVLLGPRQVGKTTLARAVAADRKSVV